MDSVKQFYYKKNCLQQLKGFCNTAQTGSISKAAAKMNLNQSTVTLQIQSLERDLKTQLFDRNKKELKLNKNGEIFYEMVLPHLNSLESLYDEFAKKQNEHRDQISIAAHHSAISHLLPPFIKRFQTKYPSVTIAIKNISLSEAAKKLQEDEVDFILYPNIEQSPNFQLRTCFTYDPILIMHKNHPLAKKKNLKLQDISKYNIVRIDKKLISLPLFEESFKEFGFKTNIDFENGNWEMVKNFVKARIGLGFISEIYLNKGDKDLVTRKLNPYFPAMEYKLAIKRGRHLNKLSEEFIKILETSK
ncbi:MAG: LysR family transcriptional regulator [Rickettsiaceae bacterium]|jgi:DNA-binding transcriptional LysR family regulator|nr:LysR family transcriptional regulator [Rickettsiaceae bacterium]